MKKIILMMILLFSISMADSVLLIKKGWQLIGLSTPIDNMSNFKKENVEEIWHFDAETQKWLGFSPDSEIQVKMDKRKIGKLKKLKNWHGFWIKSKQDWTMKFEMPKIADKPTSIDADVIELKKGWNLISLPVNSVVSADIFKGMTSWKYENNQWQLKTDEENSDFPKLGHIKNSDGIWVKADKDTSLSVMKESAKLHNFSTTTEIKEYIKEMIKVNRYKNYGIYTLRGIPTNAMPVPTMAMPSAERVSSADESGSSTNSLSAKNATSTNLQESDVDESDILKHNGKNIFYLGKEKGRANHINIGSFENITKKEKTVLNQITFNDNRNIDSFYLTDNKLTILSTLYPSYIKYDENGDRNEIKEKYQQVLVDIFDVSDINDITKVSNYAIEGNLNSSRVVGNDLYLITTFSPRYDVKYPKKYITLSPECKEYFESRDRPYDETYDYRKYDSCYDIYKDNDGYFQYDYNNPKITFKFIVPSIEGKDMQRAEIIEPKRLYASAKQNQNPNITTISKFNIEAGNYLKSTSYMGDSSITYASSNSLYLVSYQYPFYYDFYNSQSLSKIYKFKFDEDLSYKATGSVYGRALNQFSLSEYNNILRIATTEGFSWTAKGTKNILYTLQETDSLLKIKGVLSGLGKKGESIKSVRFMGDKAYLVTFKTKDPLYTIDLSNPASPEKIGELEVSGYSSYLHPVEDGKLLGIGQDTDDEGRRKGLKIELFDVSDFAHPSSLDNIKLAKGSYSEMEYNHKALAYRVNDNLFAFPYAVYNYNEEAFRDTEEIEDTTENNEKNSTGTATASNTGSNTTLITSPAPAITPNDEEYGEKNYLGVYQIKDDKLIEYKALKTTNRGWGNHRGLIFDLNETTYISFFADDTVITTPLTQKDK